MSGLTGKAAEATGYCTVTQVGGMYISVYWRPESPTLTGIGGDVPAKQFLWPCGRNRNWTLF